MVAMSRVTPIGANDSSTCRVGGISESLGDAPSPSRVPWGTPRWAAATCIRASDMVCVVKLSAVGSCPCALAKCMRKLRRLPYVDPHTCQHSTNDTIHRVTEHWLGEVGEFQSGQEKVSQEK